MPIIPLIGLLFIALKLTHVVAWSWLWVLAPFWIGFAILLGVLAMGAVGLGGWALLKGRK